VSEASAPRSLQAWLDLLERRHPRAIDLGLERCGAVWERMGAPRPAPRVITVAGTNGKGSTVATICALLGSLGFRYGSYTTPHLYRYNERIQVMGRPVTDAALLDAFHRVEAARGDTSLTYFEFGTLAAFWILNEARLDHAVMEIGLGGRLDAVNLLDADVAVITPIGLDHQEYLGADREAIGREKAGVIRRGRPVIIGDAEPPASVLAIASERGAPLRRLGTDFAAQPTLDGVLYRASGLELQLPRPALPGAYQVENMATGLAAVLEQVPGAAGQPELLRRGLESVRLPGRFVRLPPATPEDPVVWVDVGHNALAARVVAADLADLRAGEVIRSIRCVLGMLADKDAASVVAELRPVVDHWYCAALYGSRGQTSSELAARVRAVATDAPIETHESVEKALQVALAEAGPGEGILVFGSFLTAAAAGRYWGVRRSDPPPGAATTSNS
jgi:dihydrofolate synthase/folylpolyglutamate synthase